MISKSNAVGRTFKITKRYRGNSPRVVQSETASSLHRISTPRLQMDLSVSVQNTCSERSAHRPQASSRFKKFCLSRKNPVINHQAVFDPQMANSKLGASIRIRNDAVNCGHANNWCDLIEVEMGRWKSWTANAKRCICSAAHFEVLAGQHVIINITP